MSPSNTRLTANTQLSRLTNHFIIVFFAFLFYLCCADQFFATRILGLNFRWAQLAIAALSSFNLLIIIKNKENINPITKTAKYWIPFFAIYAVAALFSSAHFTTFIKLIWATFNIYGSLLLLSNPKWNENIKKGFFYGMLALAVTIWIQAIILYWLNLGGSIGPGASAPLFPDFKLLGYAQSCWGFEDRDTIYRPNAFYFEPSYVSTGLFLMFGVFLALQPKPIKPMSVLGSAFILSSIVLTSSRTGILCTIVFIVAVSVSAWLKKQKENLNSVIKILLVSTVLLSVFSIPSKAAQYMRFIAGPIGPQEVWDHIIEYKDKRKLWAEQERLSSKPLVLSSEGTRLANIAHGLSIFAQNPVIGIGVPSNNSDKPGLGQTAANTWVEILVESGLLGFLAFIFAIGKTFQFINKHSQNISRETKTLIFTLWACHFFISLNITSSFPRLDYWVLLAFSAFLLLDDKSTRQNS